MRPRLGSFVAAALSFAIALAPQGARACTDGGPPNAFCSDGGVAWQLCSVHSDCPTGQVCNASGACACAGWPCEEEECTEAGCHCCGRREETTCFVAFECAPRDAGAPDAGVRTDAHVEMDGGVDAGEPSTPSGGCSIGGPGAPTGAWLLASLLALALRPRRR